VKLFDKGKFSSVNDYLAEFDKDGALLEDYQAIEVDEWIHTGNYELNALVSGSLLKGWAGNKVITIGGDPKTGKSFLWYNGMRNAQNAGRFIWLFETENAPDKERMKNQLLDFTKIRITQPETVGDIIIPLVKFTEGLKETKEKAIAEYTKGGRMTKEDATRKAMSELPKITIVIDSISALSSDKQLGDALEGKRAQDMGFTAKELKELFNLMAVRCGKLGIGLWVSAHIYERDIMGGKFKERIIRGGMGAIYMSSNILGLAKKFLRDEDDKSHRVGIMVDVYCFESRFSVPQSIDAEILFEGGMNEYQGLPKYCDWDTCGIAKGTWKDSFDIANEIILKKKASRKDILEKRFTEKEVKELVSKDKKEYWEENLRSHIERGYVYIVGGIPYSPGMNLTFKFTDEILGNFSGESYKKMPEWKIGFAKQTYNTWIVRHLPELTFKSEDDLLIGEVFTREVLEMLDVKVRKQFEYTAVKQKSLKDLRDEQAADDAVKPNTTLNDLMEMSLSKGGEEEEKE
jgi:hypothetical protein